MSGFELLECNGIRYLVSGDRKVVHGHMDIQCPDLPLVPYLRTALATSLYFEQPLGQMRALLIGLGTGIVHKTILSKFVNWHVTTVEIDPQVIEFAHLSFSVPRNHDRLDVVQGCGFEFVMNCAEQFDWVFVDGFNEQAEPGPLGEPGFLELCNALLKPSSLMVFNGLTLHQDADHWCSQIQKTLNRRVHQIHLPETKNFLAFVLPLTFPVSGLEQLTARAERLMRETSLDFTAELSSIQII